MRDIKDVAKEYFKKEWNSDYQDFEESVIDTFIAGAKWQKEQKPAWSEEDERRFKELELTALIK